MTFTDHLMTYSNKLPQLSDRWRERYARSAWWIVLVIAIILTLIMLIAGALVYFYLRYAVQNYSASLSSLTALFVAGTVIFNALSFVVTVILLWAAVGPLRARSMQGWRLLYAAALLRFVTAIVIPIVTFLIFTATRQGVAATDYGIRDVIGFIVWCAIYVFTLHVVLQIRQNFSLHR